MDIMDFANDDDFTTRWVSNSTVKIPWLEVELDREQPFNMITLYEAEARIKKYHFEYHQNGKWIPLATTAVSGKAKVHRFTSVIADRIRVTIDEFSAPPAIAELGIYAESR